MDTGNVPCHFCGFALSLAHNKCKVESQLTIHQGADLQNVAGRASYLCPVNPVSFSEKFACYGVLSQAFHVPMPVT